MLSKEKHGEMWYYLTSYASTMKQLKDQIFGQMTVQWHFTSQEKMSSENAPEFKLLWKFNGSLIKNSKDKIPDIL